MSNLGKEFKSNKMTIKLSDIILYDWGYLHYVEQQNFISFQAARQSLNMLEDSLKIVHNDFKEQIESDENLQELDERYKGDYYEQMYGMEADTIKEMTRLQRYSILQLLYTTLEVKLQELCRLVKKEFSLKPCGNNSYLLDYWKYLIEEFGIESKTLEENFKSILDFRNIRNRIVHHNGLLSEESEKLIKDIDGFETKRLGDETVLQIVNNNHLNKLSTDMQDFVDGLLKCIDKKYTELKA